MKTTAMPKQEWLRLKAYANAERRFKEFARSDKPSKRAVKQNGSDWNRGRFINCARACARI